MSQPRSPGIRLHCRLTLGGQSFSIGYKQQRHWRLWAIDTRSDEGHGLIGRLWFEDGRVLPYDGPVACRTALFATRREARERLLKVKPSWPRAQVVPVKVTIAWHERRLTP